MNVMTVDGYHAKIAYDGELGTPAPTSPCNSSVDNATLLLHSLLVTSQELKRWLQKQGCTFESGHGGHLIVRLGAKISVLPMHGKQKELGTGLVNRIKKDLALG